MISASSVGTVQTSVIITCIFHEPKHTHAYTHVIYLYRDHQKKVKVTAYILIPSI